MIKKHFILEINMELKKKKSNFKKLKKMQQNNTPEKLGIMQHHYLDDVICSCFNWKLFGMAISFDR